MAVRNTRRSRIALGGAISSSALVSLTAAAGDGKWPMGGVDLNNSRYQSETSISAGNVANLTVKWIFTTAGDVTATPAVSFDAIYFPDFGGNFYAVDKNTGVARWSHKVSDWTGVPNDYARDDPAIDGPLLILGDQAGARATWSKTHVLSGAGAKVIAVDKRSGSLVWVTQVDQFASALVTSSPVVYKGVVYVGVASNEENLATDSTYPCCASSGSVVALAEGTGEILWKTRMAPPGYSGAGVWSSTPVIDPGRNAIYVGTGNNYSVPDEVETCFAMNKTNPYCAASSDHFDSVVALDLGSGAVKWAAQAWSYDVWNVSCLYMAAGQGNCPSPKGPDYDFGGAGPNLLRSGGRELIGIGQKSGLYWAFDPDTGSVVWKTQVGPGSSFGGIQWGTAFDGTYVYVPISNLGGIAYALTPSGAKVNGGSWAALNPANGQIVWQTATPGSCTTPVQGAQPGCMGLGPSSAAKGVVFAASMDQNPAHPTMFALDATSGKILWSYTPGSSVNAAPAIDGTTVYWGSGYGRLTGLGTGNNKLFAFSVAN